MQVNQIAYYAFHYSAKETLWTLPLPGLSRFKRSPQKVLRWYPEGHSECALQSLRTSVRSATDITIVPYNAI